MLFTVPKSNASRRERLCDQITTFWQHCHNVMCCVGTFLLTFDCRVVTWICPLCFNSINAIANTLYIYIHIHQYYACVNICRFILPSGLLWVQFLLLFTRHHDPVLVGELNHLLPTIIRALHLWVALKNLRNCFLPVNSISKVCQSPSMTWVTDIMGYR